MKEDDRPSASSGSPTPDAIASARSEAAPGPTDIPCLQALEHNELRKLADDEGLELRPHLSRPEMLFELLKQRCTEQQPCRGEGALQVLTEGFGFLRSHQHGYEPSPHDIFVSPTQIQRLNLKPGHWITGPVRAPRRGENYLALQQVDTVNGGNLEALWRRMPFDQLTPIFPQRRLQLERPGVSSDVRIVELMAPWGLGQRVLLQALPATGCTLLLTRLVQAALDGNPELYAILCLLGERPEEVTEMRRQTGPDDRREVVAATFDRPPGRLTDLSELALAKAQRMVEAGRSVLLVVDSLTALVRAYHQEVPHSGKMLAAGLDAVAFYRPKQLFGAARNTQEGGSLTVIATARVGTGSPIDELIAAEFAGKGNSDLVLDRELAEQNLYPALDLVRSCTRREDSLLEPSQTEQLRKLRASLRALNKQQRLEQLHELIARHSRNADILTAVS